MGKAHVSGWTDGMRIIIKLMKSDFPVALSKMPKLGHPCFRDVPLFSSGFESCSDCSFWTTASDCFA